MYWPAKSFNNIKHRVIKALKINTSYYNHKIMGLPATYLDPKIFPSDAGFLKDAPYIKCFIENPNHIGLHTYHSSLPAFKGTQDIELELLEICAEEIFKAEHNSYDGYVASGGTECNIQALWIYREFYKKIEKTDVLCNTLNNLGIEYFRNDNMNIITLKHRQIHESIYRKFTLVPDTHTGDPSWWKIVVMEHVNWDLITQFVNTLKGDVLNSSEIN